MFAKFAIAAATAVLAAAIALPAGAQVAAKTSGTTMQLPSAPTSTTNMPRPQVPTNGTMQPPAPAPRPAPVPAPAPAPAPAPQSKLPTR